MDSQLSIQIAEQVSLQMESLKYLMWFVGVTVTIVLGFVALYGYWIWDLNKKVGVSVSGSDCELRNDKHYSDVGNLRLEIKGDSEKLGQSFKENSEKLGRSFKENLERSSRERDSAIKALEKKVDGFMATVNDQQQSNFKVLVGVLRDIGCSNPKE